MSPAPAAEQPAAAPDGGERWHRPELGLGRDHVDVPVEDQRRSGPVHQVADHVVPPGVGQLGHACDRVGRDVLGDRGGRRGETEAIQLVPDDLLGGLFRTDWAGRRDQPFQEAERILGQVIDGPVQGVQVKGALVRDGQVGVTGVSHRPSKRLKVETLDLSTTSAVKARIDPPCPPWDLGQAPFPLPRS
jgi:hypothetical protein